jgi:glucose-1-phosphate thymidylyltransferase
MRNSLKGIILAGGTGTRFYPVTLAVNKQLLPVYDKPLIYYPLTTLMLAGIRDIVVVSGPTASGHIEQCLGDGSQWGLKLSYAVQPSPAGIADALLVAAPSIEGHPLAVVLGDNIFYRAGLPRQLQRAAARESGATIFAIPVSEPHRFGVVTLDENLRPIRLEEKPRQPRSSLAVPGLYFYDERALGFARSLKPSRRGELEITDLNRIYLQAGELWVEHLGRGSAWLDGGTPEDLYEASQFVRVIEERTGLKIACPEEVAYRVGFITRPQLRAVIDRLKPCGYRDYLAALATSELSGDEPRPQVIVAAKRNPARLR